MFEILGRSVFHKECRVFQKNRGFFSIGCNPFHAYYQIFQRNTRVRSSSIGRHVLLKTKNSPGKGETTICWKKMGTNLHLTWTIDRTMVLIHPRSIFKSHSSTPKPDLVPRVQGQSGELFLDQLFRIFDKDGDGSIDFKVQFQLVLTSRYSSD